jgi:hypothetical protein
VFDLKNDGGKLSGTVTGMGNREFKIEEGTVTGDDVAFSYTVEFNGNSRKIEYKGKVVGNELQLKSGTGDRVREITAKRPTS